uniref:group II intron maturase-specific domain-containing protein n=1 Tax=Fibrobacter sp. TaxID=35828 RepID=UPI003890F4F2
GRLNRLTKGWGAYYSVGYPSKAFHAVNGYALRRMARFLNRKSQRRYRLKFADSYYGELNHYGMYWLKWADVRR